MHLSHELLVIIRSQMYRRAQKRDMLFRDSTYLLTAGSCALLYSILVSHSSSPAQVLTTWMHNNSKHFVEEG